MASHVTTLYCAKDAWFNGSSKASDYNSSELRAAGSSRNQKYASVLGFDLSQIGTNKTVTRLVLGIRINDLQSIYPDESFYDYLGGSASDYLNRYPFVIAARRLKTYSLADVESTLTANDILGKPEGENLFDGIALGSDASKNISMVFGSISMEIHDVSNITNNEVIIGILRDNNFRTDSSGLAYARISSRSGSYPPTLTVYYDDYVPQAPYNLSPNATIRNRNGSIKLSWEYSDGGTGATQSITEVVYSTDGFATSTTELVNGNQNFCTISGSIFSTGQTIQWKARVTDTNGDTSVYSDMASFTIGATLPSAPELISPVDTIVNSSDIIRFRWKFVDGYGYSQGGFTFAYIKNGETEQTMTGTGTTPEFLLPKNLLTGGNYRWRVKCYNEFGEYGPYSDYKSIYSIGKPNAPIIISVSNNCRPVIKWSAAEQDLFTIRIMQGVTEIYNSGEQASGATNEFMVPYFLQNGSYMAVIKASNIYGYWSDTSSYNFTVNVTAPDKPNVTIGNAAYSANILFDSATTANQIYKKGEHDENFILVAELNNVKSYQDFTAAAGENMYFIRALSGDGFADSDIKTAAIEFDGIVLSDKDNLSEFINISQTYGEDKRRSISIGKDQYKIYCSGRKYPVLRSSEFQNFSEQHEYYISNVDIDLFINLVESTQVFLFRDHLGNEYYSELSNLSISENTFGYVAKFTITRLEGD